MKVVLVAAPQRAATRLRKAGFDVTAVPRAVKTEFHESEWTLTTADGETIRAQVVVTGFPATGPNILALPGNNFFAIRYVIGCLRMMGREDARQIETRPRKISYWRRPNPYDYILTPYEGGVDDTHRGPAVLTAQGKDIDVEVHLMGHIQPIDGSFRWYGRITAHPDVTELHKTGHKDVTVRLPGGEDTEARLTELDPWGHARVTGTGRPPFPYP